MSLSTIRSLSPAVSGRTGARNTEFSDQYAESKALGTSGGIAGPLYAQDQKADTDNPWGVKNTAVNIFTVGCVFIAIQWYVAPTLGKTVALRGQSVSEASRPAMRGLQTIRSFARYRADWDGYGGVAASEQTVRDAEAFYKLLAAAGPAALPSHVVMAGDGEIMMLWKSSPFYLSISFFGDKALSFYGRDADGEEYFGDDLPLGNKLPPEIGALLRPCVLMG